MWTSGQAGTINRLNGVPTSWSPTWKGSSGNPAIGNGTLTGTYIEVGRVVFYYIAVTMGSTTTFGTGVWSFTLPGTPTYAVGGEAVILDSSTSTYYNGLVLGYDPDEVTVQFNASATLLSSSGPMTWAQNDTLYITGIYVE